MKTALWFFIFITIALASWARSPYKVDGNNVIVDLEGIGVKSRVLKVEVWSDKTVKIVSGMESDFSGFKSLIPYDQPKQTKFKVDYAQTNIEITTKYLIVSIKEDGLVSIFNREGKKLILESDRFFDPSGSQLAKYKIKQRYFLNIHENIYGFGFDSNTPRYNLRDSSFTINQSLSSLASPIFFSEKGYALIWDNYSNSQLVDKKSGLELSSDLADEIQYFIIYGPTWNDIITEIRSLTGNVPMLPRWAFGQWNFPGNYSNTDEMNSCLAKYNETGIPVETETTNEYSIFKEETDILNAPEKADKRMACAPAYSKLKSKYAEMIQYSREQRLCIPAYSALPGVQKFGTFLIAGGNIKPTWLSLKGQVLAAVNLPLSGQPYWSTNIGGTMPLESSLAESSELIVRWYQFAAFTPVMRSAMPDRDLLALKNVSETSFNEALDAITLRYHLMPYIYSTASECVFNNETFTRSLLFDYQKDEKTHSVDRQFLFGKSMMICPVTKPGVKQLQVYLPEGGWYDFWTGKSYKGNSMATINITTSHIPVFVKSGAIIPYATIGSNTSDSLSSTVEIRIYPGENGSFTLYEDNNDGPGYLNGERANIVFDYSEKDKTLTVASAEGTFNGMIPEHDYHVVMVSDSTGIGNTMSQHFKDIIYKGKKVKVKF